MADYLNTLNPLVPPDWSFFLAEWRGMKEYLSQYNIEEEVNTKIHELIDSGEIVGVSDITNFSQFSELSFSDALQGSIDYAVEHGKNLIVIPRGDYTLTRTIKIPSGIMLDFNGSYVSASPTGAWINEYMFLLNSDNGTSWKVPYETDTVYIRNLNSNNYDSANQRFIADCHLFYVGCPLLAENMFLRGYDSFFYWGNYYIDYAELRNINLRDHRESTTYAIHKIGFGDNVKLSAIHYRADVPSGVDTKLVRIANSNGLIMDEIMNGEINLYNCSSASLNNLHLETGGKVVLVGSSANIDGVYAYRQMYPIIEVQTLVTAHPRPVTISNAEFTSQDILWGDADERYNAAGVAEIHITDFRGAMTLVNCHRVHNFIGSPVANKEICGVFVDVTIGNNTKRYNAFTTDFMDGRPIYKNDSLPYTVTNSASVSSVPGDLPAGIYYYRAFALLDGCIREGSRANSATNVTLDSPGSVQIDITNAAGHDVLLFRGTSSSNFDKVYYIPKLQGTRVYDTGNVCCGVQSAENDISTSVSTSSLPAGYSIINTGYNKVLFGQKKDSGWSGIAKGDMLVVTSGSATNLIYVWSGSAWVGLTNA